MMINLNSRANDREEILQNCQVFMHALEEECRKVQVFQKELPLCLQLVTRAIDACKHQITSGNEYNFQGQSECSEQTSSEGPVLEEFIPIKRVFSSSHDDEGQQYKKPKINFIGICSNNNDNKASKKSDWLRSAKLWNQSPDPTPKEVVQVVEVKRDGSSVAIHQVKMENSEGDAEGTSGRHKEAVAAAANSSVDTGETSGCRGGGIKKQEKELLSQRKYRRSWSPELHKKFLIALQQLGGSDVATPKQIKELMLVDGLTNDEVKSHLQKYRLHTRRPNPSTNNSSQTAPEYAVVGGLWVPPAIVSSTSVQGESHQGTKAIAATPTNVQDTSRQLFKKSL
ncbi:hypothetical protein Leryth_023483 [Lithospermum erythrorhizon]|nr:hypothetical protein Leryth_023483 [Lithospermum erythrorhizon]